MEKSKDFRKQLIKSAGTAIKSNNPLIMCHVMGEISAYMELTGKDEGLIIVCKSLTTIMSDFFS